MSFLAAPFGQPYTQQQQTNTGKAAAGYAAGGNGGGPQQVDQANSGSQAQFHLNNLLLERQIAQTQMQQAASGPGGVAEAATQAKYSRINPKYGSSYNPMIAREMQDRAATAAMVQNMTETIHGPGPQLQPGSPQQAPPPSFARAGDPFFGVTPLAETMQYPSPPGGPLQSGGHQWVDTSGGNQ
jgi:hypothetical protein